MFHNHLTTLDYKTCMGLNLVDRKMYASDYETLLAIEAHGDLNPVQRTQLEALKRQYGTGGGGGGGGGGKSGSFPEYKFDYAQAEKEALAKLEPYYKQKLEEAGGDVVRAKKLIEEDYQRGLRYREEDLETQLADEKRTTEEESRNLLTELNRRGILFGDIAPDSGQTRAPYSMLANNYFINPLTEKQKARKLAIERAIKRQGEISEVERKRGTEEQDIAFPRFKRELEKEKSEKAILQMVPLKEQQEYTKWNVNLQKYLQGNQS